MSNNVVKTEFGYEITWSKTDNYTSKIIVFESPKKTSMHYRDLTDRSWFVNSGNFRFRWIDTKDGKIYQQDCAEGSTFHAPKKMPISYECVASNGSLSETSTTTVEDDIRVIIPAENIGN